MQGSIAFSTFFWRTDICWFSLSRACLNASYSESRCAFSSCLSVIISRSRWMHCFSSCIDSPFKTFGSVILRRLIFGYQLCYNLLSPNQFNNGRHKMLPWWLFTSKPWLWSGDTFTAILTKLCPSGWSWSILQFAFFNPLFSCGIWAECVLWWVCGREMESSW